MNNNRCGAKTRSGTPCKRGAMTNARCNLHGGKSPETNQNARKHGLYSRALSPDEDDQWLDVQTGNIDDLIRFKTIKHATACRLAYEADQGNAGLVTVEKVNAVDGGVQSSREVKRRPDYEAIADRLLNQIIKLEKLKLEQQVRGIGHNDDPESIAHDVQAALDAMESVTNDSKWTGEYESSRSNPED